jgi:HSP20 family protein
MDLPGVKPEDLSIEAGDNEISMAGVVPPPDPPGPCRLMERPSGQFHRTIGFPGRIESEKVEAHLSGGVLTLRVPSMELDRDPTRIEVKIEGAD